jgi:Aluminium activated malate transporter
MITNADISPRSNSVNLSKLQEEPSKMLLLEEYKPNQNIQKLLTRVRLIHAFKVGIGVLLASMTVLVPKWDKALQSTGSWAVITVIIVVLQTPGETANKIFNRSVGTIVGAILAVGVGLFGQVLEKRASPLGAIFVGATNIAIGSWGAWLYTKGDSHTYAFLLGTMTYCFLVLGTLTTGNAAFVIFRIAMIALGGSIGFVVSWLPPNCRSHEVANMYLVDSILDMSVCVEALVHSYLSGDVLMPVEAIYLGEHDDVVHRCSKAIQINRTALETALSSAEWELPKTDIHGHKSCGRSIRYTLRSLLAADLIIRRNYDPLDPAIESEQRLSLAIQEIARAVCSELGQTLVFLHWKVPARIKIDEDPNALEHAMTNLKVVLKMYMEAECSNITDKADHIAFAQLMYDTGLMALDIIPNLNSTHHTKSSDNRKSSMVASRPKKFVENNAGVARNQVADF